MEKLVWSPALETDRDLFLEMLDEAATHSAPTCIGEVHYDPSLLQLWCAQGDMRTLAADLNGIANKHADKHKRIKGSQFSPDQIGLIGEGVIGLMVPLDCDRVRWDGTDKRPDVRIRGKRYDVKCSDSHRGRPSFSIAGYRIARREYDALAMVLHREPGRAEVWVCASEPGPQWRFMPPAQAGKKHYWLVTCSP